VMIFQPIFAAGEWTRPSAAKHPHP
jgi:hypothetical protein